MVSVREVCKERVLVPNIRFHQDLWLVMASINTMQDIFIFGNFKQNFGSLVALFSKWLTEALVVLFGMCVDWDVNVLLNITLDFYGVQVVQSSVYERLHLINNLGVILTNEVSDVFTESVETDVCVFHLL